MAMNEIQIGDLYICEEELEEDIDRIESRKKEGIATSEEIQIQKRLYWERSDVKELINRLVNGKNIRQ